MDAGEVSNFGRGDELQPHSVCSGKLTIGKGVLQNSFKSRVNKMSGVEVRSGSKKRSNAADVGVHSGDDDEPIGFLLKLRRQKNPKKAKVGLEGSGKKGQISEAREEPLADEGEDSGGMDDTLASFRKKLKAPKKGVGSESAGTRSLVLNGPMVSGGAVDVKSTSEAVKKDQDMCEDGSKLTVKKGFKSKNARKMKSGNNSLKGKRVQFCDDFKKSSGSHFASLDVPNEESSLAGGASDHSLVSRPEDSSSKIFEKAEASLLEHSTMNSRLIEGSRTLEDGLIYSTGIFSDAELNLPSSAAKEVCAGGPDGMLDESSKNRFTGPQNSESGPDSGNCMEVAPVNQQNLTSSLVESIKLPEICIDTHDSLPEFHSIENCVRTSKSADSIERCDITLQRSYGDAGEQNHVHDDGCQSINQEVDGGSPKSATSDEHGSFQEDAASVPESGRDSPLENVHRGGRPVRKRRHGDMAYEGDADWENLINEQGSFENQQLVEGYFSLRAREKLDEAATVAAISAGLKAQSICPIERIKFKEFLKHRGGLQEYLECRNHILSLWSKDVTRILPLVDCRVTDKPCEDESVHDSLIREIYVFLDQRGYINCGIASMKEKTETACKHNYKLLKETNLEGASGASVADSEDGVAFILGQVKNSDLPQDTKNGVTADDLNQSSQGTVCGEPADSMKLEVSSAKDSEELQIVNCHQNGSINTIPTEVPNGDAPCKLIEKLVPVGMLDDKSSLQSVQPDDLNLAVDHPLQCDPKLRKTIIVIGAGPAGLTAARHLLRQGYGVTILEARDRIGGRVFTDRSSLSVPVDLGASIITGVEADVSTDRRPDPSSLVCAQLGLELTVLNSACPLYDIVTGQKVPSELDDALEAEYNNLLDDMEFLVAEKGDHAMSMSLEDGLEFALRKHRMLELATDMEETECRSSVDAAFEAKATSVDDTFGHERFPKDEVLSPLERRVMNWHFAHLEYGCAALLKDVSLPNWNQDDAYGGFGGAHCMIKGGYSAVVESLADGLPIHLNQVVTNIAYTLRDPERVDQQKKVRISTSNGNEFSGDAVLITVPLGCLKAGSIKFAPALPEWKQLSIQRLGFGVLNKVVLEFPEVFWDDSVDYFGATAEETDCRGQCFMFWNVRKTVGAPVLIALLVGKAAIEGQNMSSMDHVSHAVAVLRRLFGVASVPDPVASVVTDWGRDPFSYGAYSYVAIGASGEDYDLLGRPVENCLFFAGEATCKEHPDTVGGAMMSGLREAVRLIDIFTTGNDYTAEVETREAAKRRSEFERDEVREITKRLEAVELSNVLYKNSLDRARTLTREALLRDMFFSMKTTAGRLHLAKRLLNLTVESLKSFAGTKAGLTTLNLWMLDSLGKDGTQLLRQCVRLLVLVSTNLLAVRSSGIGKTVKEKVCVHTSRDIRAIASQLVNVWLELFRKEKASSGGSRLLRQAAAMDSSRRRLSRDPPPSGKPPLRSHVAASENKRNLQNLSGTHVPSDVKEKRKPVEVELDDNRPTTEEEKAAFAAEEAARAAAKAAAEALASTEASCNRLLQLPKIPSFHKFARRDQYAQMDEMRWSGGVLGRQDCISEIDSRNCRVRDWSVDFSAACVHLDSSRVSADNVSQRSHSNDMACHPNFREHSGESAAVDSSIFTSAWVDAAGSVGIKDYHAIDRWQSQAAAATDYFSYPTMHMKDEEDSNTSSRHPSGKHDGRANESSLSHVTMNKVANHNHPRGADRIKQAVVDYVASLLMPLYKARKIDKEGYKSIMKKTATKVMESATDAEKAMAVSEFLDFKRKNKIRPFVDTLIERHMAVRPAAKS